jgi:hypothetical protein
MRGDMISGEQDDRDPRKPAPSGARTSNAGNESSAPPAISLPKGGGALRSIDEQFTVNAANGICVLSIPLPFSKARSDVGLNLSLDYNSGSGNGAFGLGWNIQVPAIQRRTDKQLPRCPRGPPISYTEGRANKRPAKAPVLHHMRKKPSLAGRRGRGGLGFNFILKQLLHMSVLRPAIATASCAHPAMLSAKSVIPC